MQLILALAVLMMLGGKSENAPHAPISSSDMFEMLKYISGGNDEIEKIVKEAEQVTEIISAIAPIATAFGANDSEIKESEGGENSKAQDIGLILKPISNIADDSIYNALSHAI